MNLVGQCEGTNCGVLPTVSKVYLEAQKSREKYSGKREYKFARSFSKTIGCAEAQAIGGKAINQLKEIVNKSGDGDGSRAVFDDVDRFRSQG